MDGKSGRPTFTKIKPNGARTDAGWALETALDVEWAHAIAPQANIVLVEAKSSTLGNLLSAVDTARNRAGVSAVSMSWGAGEFSSESAYDYHFTTPSKHTGITFIRLFRRHRCAGQLAGDLAECAVGGWNHPQY
jgi:subtilase family serine protease